MIWESTEINARANSKAILSGENAVVFGATSVACAIRLDNTCRMDVWNNSFFQISVGPILAQFDKSEAISAFNTMKLLCDSKHHEEVTVALHKRPLVWIQAVLGQLLSNGEDFPYFSADADLAMPLGSGLGGSTTSTILVLKTLNILRGHSFSPQRLFDLAYFGDQIAHGGSASGTDSGAIVYGGFITFKHNKGVKLIRKNISLELLVCCSGQNQASGTSLSMFRRLRDQNPKWFRARIRKIDALSQELMDLLRNSDELDLHHLGMLMNRNQRLLKEMGVSTPEIDDLVQTATARGALGAKLTGGGCGGVVIIVGQSDVLRDIAHELADAGRRVFLTKNSPLEESL